MQSVNKQTFDIIFVTCFVLCIKKKIINNNFDNKNVKKKADVCLFNNILF